MIAGADDAIEQWRVEAAAQAGIDAMNPGLALMLFGDAPRTLASLAEPVRSGLILDAAKMLCAALPDWPAIRAANKEQGT